MRGSQLQGFAIWAEALTCSMRYRRNRPLLIPASRAGRNCGQSFVPQVSNQGLRGDWCSPSKARHLVLLTQQSVPRGKGVNPLSTPATFEWTKVSGICRQACPASSLPPQQRRCCRAYRQDIISRGLGFQHPVPTWRLPSGLHRTAHLRLSGSALALCANL